MSTEILSKPYSVPSGEGLANVWWKTGRHDRQGRRRRDRPRVRADRDRRPARQRALRCTSTTTRTRRSTSSRARSPSSSAASGSTSAPATTASPPATSRTPTIVRSGARAHARRRSAPQGSRSCSSSSASRSGEATPAGRGGAPADARAGPPLRRVRRRDPRPAGLARGTSTSHRRLHRRPGHRARGGAAPSCHEPPNRRDDVGDAGERRQLEVTLVRDRV